MLPSQVQAGLPDQGKRGLWDVIPVLWGKWQHLQCGTGGLCVCCRERWWFTEHKKIRIDHAAGLALYRCQIGSNRFWRAIGKPKLPAPQHC